MQQSTSARTTSPVAQAVAALRRHRAASSARAEHRQLVADLSVFQSQAELAEISAILRLHSDSDAAPVRAALQLTPAAA